MKGWLPRRIRFVKSNTEQDAGVRRVSVELLRPDDGSYVGKAERPSAEVDLLRAGAEAAAAAVVTAAGTDNAEVKVEDIERVKMFGREIVVASVSATYRGQTFALFGVCEVHEDAATAGALAVLSATNRVLELS
ncbi:MAG TPA: hypothetical protein VJL31_10560 [Gemmatimonadales bacterium]|nr:hypothetical protein [Gemmatimonadales bacterium]